MGVTVRQLVESITTFGVLSTSEVAALREMPLVAQLDVDSESLIRELVRTGKLTKFQAMNLYQGRAKGLVFGEYVILDKIGAGGMGQVYKAQHKRMKRIVALKVLPQQSVKSPKAVQRFYQEVEVAAKLTHPNIVTAYDAGEAHGMHYLVMEFVDGKDLSSYLSKNGPLSLEQTLNVIAQTAKGLAYAHGLNIIHRDIKPSNLLVDRAGVVKILDMGLARVSNPLADAQAGAELTADGEVMGTMDYMAPEQAMDTRSADHRADIYSLGCTMYRLYTGQTPFVGDTAVQKILSHREKPIPSLKAARPETPDIVERIYQKMMAKNVADRTQTMAAVVSSLETLMSGVDDDRSSVMLGAEPMENDGGSFLPGSSIGGGSSLGGMMMPGSSGIGVSGKPNQAGPAIQTIPQFATTTGKAPTVSVAKTAASRDTDAIVRSIMQAKPAAKDAPSKSDASVVKSKRNPMVLIGAGAAAVVVLGAAAFFLLRKSEPEPDPAVVALAPTVKPAAAAATATATTTVPAPTSKAAVPPTVVASATAADAKLPEPSNTGTPADLFGLSTTPPGTSPAIEPTPNNPTVSTPSNHPPTQPVVAPAELTGEVDLLALVDPATMGQHARWKRDGGGLYPEGTSGPGPRVLVPYTPPENYDLTAVVEPREGNVQFGIGLIVGGRSCGFYIDGVKSALGEFDGKPWYDGTNPTMRSAAVLKANQAATIACAVRNNRIYVEVDGKPFIDWQGDLSRLSAGSHLALRPGQLFLFGNTGASYQSLKIAPPTMSLPAAATNVNLAASFQSENVSEGVGTGTRGGVQMLAEPNKYAKIFFPGTQREAYSVSAVVERLAGNEDMLTIGLPFANRRTNVVFDHRPERLVGVQFLSFGGADINPSGRRFGFQLTPGDMHIVNASLVPDPKGWRVKASIDGRQMVDYVGNDFNEAQEFAVPDRLAVALCTWGSNWRIVRLDIGSVDGSRSPIPATDDRAKALEYLRVLTSPADAKGANLDAKLLAVDNLRRKAATELKDAAIRYAALDEALRIATAAGDLPGAFEAAEDICSAFDVDDRGVQTRVLDVFKATRSTQLDAKRQFVEEAAKYMRRAAKAEQWAYALELNAAVDRVGGSTNPDLKRELKACAAEYAFARTLFEAADAARNPADGAKTEPAGYTALGKYLCFAVGDWPSGLKALAQGDDAGLKAAADMELGDVRTGDAKFAVAEKWWDLSEKEKVLGLKWAEAERASLWYRRAAGSSLADKSKSLLPRRMTSLSQLRRSSGGAGSPRRPLDAQKIGDHWYKAYPAVMQWDTAVQTCENLGGNLVIPDHPQENEAIARLMLQSLGGQSAERASVWIGVSDTEQEGKFVRLDGAVLPPPPPPGAPPGPPPGPPPGSPGGPPFFKWGGGEPNNGNGDEDFVYMEISLQNNQINYDWRDGPRYHNCYFICEWDH